MCAGLRAHTCACAASRSCGLQPETRPAPARRAGPRRGSLLFGSMGRCFAPRHPCSPETLIEPERFNGASSRAPHEGGAGPLGLKGGGRRRHPANQCRLGPKCCGGFGSWPLHSRLPHVWHLAGPCSPVQGGGERPKARLWLQHRGGQSLRSCHQIGHLPHSECHSRVRRFVYPALPTRKLRSAGFHRAKAPRGSSSAVCVQADDPCVPCTSRDQNQTAF